MNFRSNTITTTVIFILRSTFTELFFLIEKNGADAFRFLQVRLNILSIPTASPTVRLHAFFSCFEWRAGLTGTRSAKLTPHSERRSPPSSPWRHQFYRPATPSQLWHARVDPVRRIRGF